MEFRARVVRRPTYIFEAVEDGKVAAEVHLSIKRGRKGRYGYVHEVFSEEAHRGKGLARKLNLDAIAKARKLKCYKIVLTSNDKNIAVHAMYEKLGYKRHGLEFRLDLE